MTARIRPATAADLFWLRLLLGQLMDSLPTAYPHADLKALEAQTAVLAARLACRDPTFLCFVAEDEQVIAGFVTGQESYRIGAPAHYLFVDFFYVAPPYRGQGVGRALSTAIIEAAKERGMEALEFIGQAGDKQWRHRGWTKVGNVFALPIDAAHASVVSTHALEDANGI